MTDYAIEYIPKGAVNVRGTVSFSPDPSRANPSSATLSLQPFEPDASPTSQNPDGTHPTPAANEQAARLVWTWTGTGPSSTSSGTATFTVTFEEPAKPLTVSMFAKRGGEHIHVLHLGQYFDWVVHVHNPNDDSVTGSVSVDIDLPVFGRADIEYRGGVGKCSKAVVIQCPLALGAGESASLTIFGDYVRHHRPFTQKGHTRPEARVYGTQDPDEQNVGGAHATYKVIFEFL